MAGNIVAMRQRPPSPPSGRSADTSTARPTSVPGWIPVALGATVVVAGFGRRKPVATAVTALAGVAAVAALRSDRFRRIAGPAAGKRPLAALAEAPEVERSITIGKPANELYRRWRDPNTLSQVMDGFATVRASGDGRMQWSVEGPLGRSFEWDSETIDDRPDDAIGWRSLAGAAIPNQGSVRFRPAPADRGTVATLRLRFDPPGGALGNAAVKLLGRMPLDLAADGVLRRFKSLVETGEIPTTERQPAARADTR